MEAVAVQLGERVAVPADTWLAGDRQDEALQRLDAAVAARRAYLQPPLLR